MITDQLKTDLTAAMKAGEQLKTETLRGILSAIHNEEISARSKKGNAEFGDSDILSVIRREAKKRREAIDMYSNAGREELAKKEKDELSIIESYLPPQLDDSAIENLVDEALASGASAIGDIIKYVIQKADGGADAGRVSVAAKRKLEQG